MSTTIKTPEGSVEFNQLVDGSVAVLVIGATNAMHAISMASTVVIREGLDGKWKNDSPQGDEAKIGAVWYQDVSRYLEGHAKGTSAYRFLLTPTEDRTV